MLNTSSGMVDLLKPSSNAGAAAGKRSDAAANDSSDMFGDTLRGQMAKHTDNQGSEPKKVEKKTDNQKDKTDSAAGDDTAEAAPAKAEAQPAEHADKAGKATDKTQPEDEKQAEGTANPSLLAQFMADNKQAVTPTGKGDAAVAGVAADGKDLPQSMSLVAAMVRGKGAATTAAQTDGKVDLPAWLQDMENAARGQDVTALQAKAANSAVAGGQETETPETALNTDFLKDVKAVLGELNTKDSGTAERSAKGQNGDALFKLLGSAVN